MLFITGIDYTTKATTSKRRTTVALGLQNVMLLQRCRTFQVAGNSHSDIIDTLESVFSFLGSSVKQRQQCRRYYCPHLVTHEVHVSTQRGCEVD